MFTGIVEETGIIKTIDRGAKSAKLTISGDVVTKDSQAGDSIAVNGICLTATSIKGNCFTADVMAETMRRTSLGVLTQGSKVNLERAMTLNGRFGGHIVSGHIDGTGTVSRLEREDNAVWVTINTTKAILKYIIEKGSITIDGVSLTVAYVDSNCFQVSIIPHTAAHTTLLTKKTGDIVNLENDVIGKYVEKLMSFERSDIQKEKNNGLSEAFLFENGFM